MTGTVLEGSSRLLVRCLNSFSSEDFLRQKMVIPTLSTLQYTIQMISVDLKSEPWKCSSAKLLYICSKR